MGFRLQHKFRHRTGRATREREFGGTCGANRKYARLTFEKVRRHLSHKFLQQKSKYETSLALNLPRRPQANTFFLDGMCYDPHKTHSELLCWLHSYRRLRLSLLAFREAKEVVTKKCPSPKNAHLSYIFSGKRVYCLPHTSILSYCAYCTISEVALFPCTVFARQKSLAYITHLTISLILSRYGTTAAIELRVDW